MAIDCARCNVPMDIGFVASRSLDFTRPDDWVGGAPESSALFGTQVRGKEHYQLVAYRCPNCAVVQFFAPQT